VNLLVVDAIGLEQLESQPSDVGTEIKPLLVGALVQQLVDHGHRLNAPLACLEDRAGAQVLQGFF
jgi:hypothetical protein